MTYRILTGQGLPGKYLQSRYGATVLVLLLMLLWIGSLSAGEFEVGSLPQITLQEAKAKALEMNSSYRSREAAYQAAKWGKNSARAAMYPSLSLDGAMLYQDPATVVRAGASSYTLNHDIRSFSFNLAQPLYLGGKLWQAYHMAQTNEELAALSLQSQKMQVLTDVESKYLSVLQLKKVFDLAQKEQVSATSDLEMAELKMQSGILSRVDYTRFQAGLANKQVAALQAQTALQLALKDFANYLGETAPVMPVELEEDAGMGLIPVLAEYNLEDTDKLSAEAGRLLGAQNLSLQSLEKSVQLADRAYTMAKASFLPTIMLTGSREYSENGLDRYSFDGSTQLILSASLPLLPGWGNYAATRKAKEEARKARLDVQTAGDGIRLGLQSAVLNLVSSAKQVRSSRLALAYNEDLYRQLEERFKLNMLSASDLLDAELMLSAARLAETNAVFSYLKARTALMQLLAWEDASRLDELIITSRNINEE